MEEKPDDEKSHSTDNVGTSATLEESSAKAGPSKDYDNTADTTEPEVDADFLSSDFSESDDPFEYYKQLKQAKSKPSEETASASASVLVVSTEKGFTKKGKVRQRKRYEKSVQERKQEKLEEKVNKHQLHSTCTCKFRKCDSKISSEQRGVINAEYWELSDLEKQVYVSSYLSRSPVIRRRADTACRNTTVKYSLRDETGENQQVCKTFFLATLGYNPKNDRIITNVLQNTKKLGVPFAPDKRGTNPKEKVDRELIRAHVELYSPNVSHYRREHAPDRRYLPSDLTITSMHENFVGKHDLNCSYELYRKVVSKDLNISFADLGHEECETCEHYKLHDPSHAESNSPDCQVCKEWTEHVDKAKDARDKYREDATKSDPQTLYVAADLEKVIMLPRIDMFKIVVFTPRIIVFNESFVPLGEDSQYMPVACLWHEAITRRKKKTLLVHSMLFFALQRYEKCCRLA